jgi:PAS domain S-box-containing protein
MDSPAGLPDAARLFERAACGLLVTDVNGRIRTVNATFAAWIGYPVDTMVEHMRLQDLFTIGGRVFHQTHLAPLLEMQGSVAEVQLDMRHAAGHTLPMLINIVRSRDADGTHDDVAVFVATDRRKYEHELLLARKNAEATLSELRVAQQQLQESRDVLGVAMRGAKMGVWSRDIASGAVWFSAELGALVGLAENSFGGTLDAFYALIHPSDLPAFKAVITRPLTQTSDGSVEFRMLHAQGHWVPMAARMRLGCDAASTPTTVFGVATDISDRIVAESTMRREAAILSDQSDAIVVLDAQGCILEANPATVRMTGYDVPALAGRSFLLFYDADLELTVRAAINDAIALQREWRGELMMRRKDGSARFTECVIKPLVDGKAVTYGAVVVSRDITERQLDAARLRELNAQLALADRKKDEFLATLAHELRNPLAPLRNVLEILRMKSSNDPQLIWAQDVFGRQMEQMSHLVDDLMDVSRITQGRVQLRRQPVDLAVIMRGVAESCAALVSAGSHRLSMQLPSSPVTLDADPTRLTQILTNLINNAAKYTPDGGSIWFDARVEVGTVRITVRDSGIGIARENLANVFTMFSQLEPALERAQGGLGIGLALVKGLVELHGGTIGVDSAGVGLGSEFTVCLPTVATAATALRAPIASQSGVAPEARVLVVDDNRDGADMLRMALDMLGYEVECVYDAASALVAGAAFRPQYMLLDIGLPDLDGYALARRIRRTEWGAPATLIAATGWGQQSDKEKALAAGFDLHMVKPLDFALLDSEMRARGISS